MYRLTIGHECSSMYCLACAISALLATELICIGWLSPVALAVAFAGVDLREARSEFRPARGTISSSRSYRSSGVSGGEVRVSIVDWVASVSGVRRMVWAMVCEVLNDHPLLIVLDVWVSGVRHIAYRPIPQYRPCEGRSPQERLYTVHRATGPRTGHEEYLPGPDIRNSLVPVGILIFGGFRRKVAFAESKASKDSAES